MHTLIVSFLLFEGGSVSIDARRCSMTWRLWTRIAMRPSVLVGAPVERVRTSSRRTLMLEASNSEAVHGYCFLRKVPGKL